MDDIVVIKIWAQLAFRKNLTDTEAALLDKCAAKLLVILDNLK